MKVFVSVGTGLNPSQEAFVSAVEDRLRAVGLVPCTIGRNTFSTDAPLRAVAGLMDDCAGVLVIALERYYFPTGVERRGTSKQKNLQLTSMPTPWNQIEAAMGYSRGLPLFVLTDERLRCDGLLEKGNDWYVQEVSLDPAALNSPAFVGLLESWRGRISTRTEKSVAVAPIAPGSDPATMTLGQLVGSIKPQQLWAALTALSAALAASFALGAKLASNIGSI